MAVILPDYNSVFVHVPKTGGTSVQRWLLENTKSYVTKGSKHHSLISLEEKYGKFDFSFTTVRNPWDWCVSWYFFRRDRAIRRIQSPKNKGKFTLEHNQKVLKDFEKGFDYFLETTSLKPQCSRIVGVTTVLRLENIKDDIMPISKKFKIKANIPFVNTSNRNKNYRQYYNTNTQKIVEEKFKDDIDAFDYKF